VRFFYARIVEWFSPHTHGPVPRAHIAALHFLVPTVFTSPQNAYLESGLRQTAQRGCVLPVDLGAGFGRNVDGMKAALLSDRGVVEVVGGDARRFLHGLLTTDIETMTEATPRFAALLTPQGKIVVDMLAVRVAGAADEERYLLDCPRALAETFAAKLNFYKLRARVSVADLSATLGVIALWDGDPTPARDRALACYADPRPAALGWRALVPVVLIEDFVHAQGADRVDSSAYDAHRIALGIPDGGRDFSYGDAFPHEADMDQLNGIDFAKGCYVGQEVVSRMQHRGTARSRVVPVRLDGAAPQPGAPVDAGEKTVGAMGSAAAGRGLALLRLDRVADALAAGTPLIASEARLYPVKPAWATFPWPGEAKAVT
jgi:folate-binding protein YgfZ